MTCDGCAVADVEIPLAGESGRPGVKSEAIARGWRVDQLAHLCPTCRKVTVLPGDIETEAMW